MHYFWPFCICLITLTVTVIFAHICKCSKHLKDQWLLFSHVHRAEHQSARMSKITNDGLTRFGTGRFIAVPIWQQWASKG